MPGESEDRPKRVNWVRKPRRADLSGVPLSKLDEASKRGIAIDPGLPPGQDDPTKRLADVTKIVVEGMPAPNHPKETDEEQS
ncbi:MAG: hypothetical protein A2900_05290 [Candidatus Chisholmbacteria bacterium RIFCSPLOWO2_01_FULL_50_28]|uniref:Uncharacterized protein n=1 Tax=Candidatus Chisholmbacteria bacterium RIFCSPHIGHO2_01_FULL_52_32 TaxID=1797591 RepID=A0A1G1VRX3_9BACT|nr:MAG: hypothetical protein A2786_01455 [Candidatus Chisholmbacteria bacterium RIFCSPHIGHO2_01_FULL_52_32]OGY20462.1 MAG: hypothetical protein A2900_05290 [Candidatus Chisholmbacteria bacterium RIFCSPLOWO2_01_FULL_50_28]